jgi:hypothetical protein
LADEDEDRFIDDDADDADRGAHHRGGSDASPFQ